MTTKLSGDVDHDLVLQTADRSVRAVIGRVGAALRGLSVGGVSVTPAPLAGAAPYFCGKVLVPWPNRVADGRWSLDGRTQRLPITDPVHHTALHGLLCTTAYGTAQRSSSSITLAAPVTPCDGYPFSLDTSVTYRLTRDGLHTTHAVRNTGERHAPVGIGAHPFLTVGDVPAERLILTVEGEQHVDVDDRLIPVGTSAVDGTRWDLRAGRPVADLDLDDCWVVRPGPDGSTHTLRAGDGRSVSLWADPRFAYAHVFVTRAFPTADGDVTAVALEPMTAEANALNSGHGLRWLAPGEVFSASWAISYRDGS